MAFHDQPRFTKDIDILALPEDLEIIKKAFEELGYLESSSPWTFINTKITLYRFMKTENEDSLLVDILIGGEKITKI